MADEINEAFKVTRAALLADGTFFAACPKVYASDQVPQGEADMYCLIDFVGGSDFNGAGISRIATSFRLLCRLIKKNAAVDSTMRAADRAMDAVLQTIVRTQSGGYVFSVRRELPYRRGFVDEANNKWSESGGYYRYFVA